MNMMSLSGQQDSRRRAVDSSAATGTTTWQGANGFSGDTSKGGMRGAIQG